MTRASRVTVVLPAYNEAVTIERTVAVTLATLESCCHPGSFEVIVAEDGCTDSTPATVAELARRDDRVVHVHSDERLGRGQALTRAFRASTGDVLAYIDTDLATDMSHLPTLLDSIRSDGYDVATGSRLLPGSVADRPLLRGVASRTYNALARLFLSSEIHDHQCGFKAFDRDALFTILSEVEADHWFWDTEVLVAAQRAGYDIAEFPVNWTPKDDSKVDLIDDAISMGRQILALWWRLRVLTVATPSFG